MNGTYHTYTTVKIAFADNVYGQREYQVQELCGFGISDWTLLPAARANAEAVELERTRPAVERGWGGRELS